MTDLPSLDFCKHVGPDPYPEHTRLLALNGRNQTVGDFIEWLGEKGYVLCEWIEEADGDPSGFYPLGRSVSSWIAEYFGINPAKIEQEKRAMLEEMRRLNAAADAEGEVSGG